MIHRPPTVRLGAALLLGAALSAQTHLYDVTDLGPVPGQSTMAGVTASDISADGSKICGSSVWAGYVWDAATGMRALPKPPGESVAIALSVTDDGSAVGYSGLTSSSQRAQYWAPSGALQSLHQTGWYSSVAVAHNRGGQVLLSVGLPGGSTIRPHAFLGTPGGGFVDLAPGASFSDAIDLNGRGDVLFGDPQQYLLRDAQGQTWPLGLAYRPWSLTELGQVAGLSSGVVALWTRGAGWQPLPVPPTLRLRHLGGANSLGQVVASHAVQTGISPPSYAYYGHLYTEGLGWTDLNTVVDPSQAVRVKQLAGITDDGKIAGYGSVGPDNRAMLLEPRFASVYGSGCGSGDTKALAAGRPLAGGRIALLGSGGRPGGFAALLVGFAPASQPLLGCTRLVDANATVLAVPVGAAGQSALVLDLPPFAAGVSLFAQYVALDPAAPNGLFTASNGVRVDVQ